MKVDTESRVSRTTTRTGVGMRSETVTRFTSTRTSVVDEGVFWGKQAARASSRAVRGAATWLGETVLPAGWVLLGVLVLGVAGGMLGGRVEGWVAASIAAVLLLLSLPFLIGGHDYRVRLSLGDDRVVAGSEVTGQLNITNRAERLSLPSVIDIPVGEGLVEAHIPLLLGGAEHAEELTISAQRRGVILVGPMTVGRGDPIGIVRRELSWPQVEKIFVHPVTVAIPSTSAGLNKDLEGTPTRDIVDSDLSFHAIREYAPGDSRRHIHWKSTAKTGVLMVRQFEETRRSSIAILLDVHRDEYASDDEFELAVSAAASLGVQGVRDRREVQVTVSADVPELSRFTVQSIRNLPTVSGRALLDGFSEITSSERAVRLEAVTALTVQSSPQLSIAFLVTGSAMPVSRIQASAVSMPLQARTVAVRCEPGAEPTLRRVGEISVLTIGQLHDLSHLIARGALL